MAVDLVWGTLGWTLIGGTLAWIGERRSHTHLATPPEAAAARRRTSGAAFATSVLFGLAAWRAESNVDTLVISLLVLVGVQLAMIDIARLVLPSTLVLPLYPSLLAVLGLGAIVEDRSADLLRAVLGMIVLPGTYLAVALLTRGGIGAGDVLLAGPIGLVLAWHNWTTVVAGTVLAFAIAAATSLALIVVGRHGRRRGIPFGPGMLCGAFTAVVLQVS